MDYSKEKIARWQQQIAEKRAELFGSRRMKTKRGPTTAEKTEKTREALEVFGQDTKTDL